MFSPQTKQKHAVSVCGFTITPHSHINQKQHQPPHSVVVHLEHLLDELVDLLSLLATSATLNEVVQLLAGKASLGGGQLHGPQKVANGLEVGAHGEDLVHDVLDASDAEAAQAGLDHVVRAEGHSLARHLFAKCR